MPFEIVRNDIVNMRVDAIVNTANPKPVVGAGTDSRIHEKAGPGLLAARQKIGEIACGSAVSTPAFQLNAKYVIHTVGPVWVDGQHHEETLLRSCYENALRVAMENKAESIAFPLISTGTYGFPKDKALRIAIAVFSEFLLTHEMQIYLVVFDGTAYRLSEKLFQQVASYIDENYVDAWEAKEYSFREDRRNCESRRRRAMEICTTESLMPCEAAPLRKATSLEDVLKQADAGFTETLLKLIDQSGKKDSEIYKKALLTKQHFSKIRNNPNYKPTKPTAVALALALELNLEQTKDLIGRAGYALTNSSKFDLIIQYFIVQGYYNLVEINVVLYDYDQSLLGGKD